MPLSLQSCFKVLLSVSSLEKKKVKNAELWGSLAAGHLWACCLCGPAKACCRQKQLFCFCYVLYSSVTAEDLLLLISPVPICQGCATLVSSGQTFVPVSQGMVVPGCKVWALCVAQWSAPRMLLGLLKHQRPGCPVDRSISVLSPVCLFIPNLGDFFPPCFLTFSSIVP